MEEIRTNQISYFKALKILNGLNVKLHQAEKYENKQLQKEIKEKIDIIAKAFDIESNDDNVFLFEFLFIPIWFPFMFLLYYFSDGGSSTALGLIYLSFFLWILLVIFYFCTNTKYMFYWIAVYDKIVHPLNLLWMCSIPVILVIATIWAILDNPIIILIIGAIAAILYSTVFVAKTAVKGTFKITSAAAEIIAEECGADKKTAKNIGIVVGAASVMYAASEVKELVGEAIQDFSPDSEIAMSDTEDTQALQQGESSREGSWVDGHWRTVGDSKETWVDGHWRNGN